MNGKRDTRPKSTGRVPRGKSLPAAEWAEIRKEVLGGATYRESAEKHGITTQGVWERAKAEGWTRKARAKSTRKAIEKTIEKHAEEMAARMLRWNATLVERGDTLLQLMVAEFNERIVVLRPTRNKKGEMVASGNGDPKAFHALTAAYKDLVHSVRLQTGQSTSNPAGTLDATVSVEGFDAYAARMIAEKGLEDHDD